MNDDMFQKEKDTAEYKVPLKLHTASYREMKAKCKPAQTKFPMSFPPKVRRMM